MARKQANHDWSSGRPAKIQPAMPTEFEIQAKRLRLTHETYATSDQLKNWCERHRNRCYVPEWLLKKWGISVDPNVA